MTSPKVGEKWRGVYDGNVRTIVQITPEWVTLNGSAGGGYGESHSVQPYILLNNYTKVEEVTEKPKVGDKYIGNNTKHECRVTAIGEAVVLLRFNAHDEDLEMAVNLGDIPKYYTKVEPFFEEGDEWVHYNGHHYRVTNVFRRHGKMYAQVDVTRDHGDVIVVLLNEVAYRDGNFRNYKKAK
jgi:hypothetical protein